MILPPDGTKACCVPGRGAVAGAAPAPMAQRAHPSVASVVVAIPGGQGTIGTDAPVFRADGEGPARRISLRPFRIDAQAVTNARFAAFVAGTGYRSDAERYGWSYVFRAFLPPGAAVESPPQTPWWAKVQGACWSAPEGPGSSTADRADHPVIHVSWNDAAAYAAWSGGRLPTEAEWEHAARGGDRKARFPWGADEPDDANAGHCNIWQGSFPQSNTAADGFAGTAPADSFAPNAYGLFNMCGNVWEWCADAFRVRSLSSMAKARNAVAASAGERVMKGGSYLCHESYCYRYRIAARTGHSPDTSAGHTGFRIAYDG
ncbi:formylglycine-generating enzyme family protein [Roseomonas terrae]|uniref:Formylglycine-generating enzyme family protein n=1 Tax=Neoroseomonas terrae TaxID=424799 RepID=A0ABS5ELV7_9PROT|nr:formylglycine-generating enzyme family protein [Neoroseomonas terrae]MBR0652019.1 formylglycine-generating enzyme family protein [Neoroseomonas terrae]